jgi:hypothetical protein
LEPGHHLRLRGYTWFLRVRWARRLARFGFSGELIRSLKTQGRREAAWRCRVLLLKLDALMSQSPLPTKSEVEGRVRAWIDERIWAQEQHRAETNGFDFLEVTDVELMGDNDAREIDAFIRFTGYHLFDQRPDIAAVLRGERDGAEFEPIIQSAARTMGQTIDPSTASGRLWARSILRGYSTFLDEVREAVASIPKQIAAAASHIAYPSFDFLMFWDDFEAHKTNSRAWKNDTASGARGARNIFKRMYPTASIKEICETALVSDFKTKLLLLNRDY